MKVYDVAIIGAGAGGITTSIYCARAGLDVALIEGGLYGGQIMNAGTIENYTGAPQVDGFDLAKAMEKQAREQSGIVHIYGFVDSLKKDYVSNVFNINLGGHEIVSKTAVVASGVKHKEIDVKNSDHYKRGVSYCAVCDGAFFKGKDVAVIGGGDSAAESALYMSEIAKSVTILHRRDELRAEKELQDRVFAKDNIDIIWNAEVVEFKGVDGLIFKDDTEDRVFLDVETSFVNIGVVPNTNFIKTNSSSLLLDGFVYTDEYMHTIVDGLYAVGDVREHSIRQIVNATGDGAMAADNIVYYLQNNKHNY